MGHRAGPLADTGSDQELSQGLGGQELWALRETTSPSVATSVFSKRQGPILTLLRGIRYIGKDKCFEANLILLLFMKDTVPQLTSTRQ